jgi:tetratricopeptide (TPR) repeat protein
VPPPPSPLSQGPFIEDPTDEDYAAAARAALSAKDHRLALEQAAAAASLRPLHEPHTKLLDEAIAATKGPLQALELKPGGTFFGLVAARARALARVHRMGEALDCLFQATAFAPRTPFLVWALPWVAHASDARRVTPQALALSIIQLIDKRPAPRNLETAGEIAAKVQAAAGDGDGTLLVARSRVLRALGRQDEALALLAGRNDWRSVVERGAVHRDRNDTAERVRCFEEAATLRPADVATLLDLGDAYIDDGRLEEAEGAFEKVLAVEPSQRWAKASLDYVHSLATGEPMPAPPDEIGRPLFVDAGIYVSWLSDPIDPIAGVLRSVEQTPSEPVDRPIRIRVRAERPLAASARLAFELVLARLGREGTLEVAYDGDRPPRQGPSWKSEGQTYVPLAPRPPDEVMSTVAAIAEVPFGWKAWRTAAAASRPASIEHLLAAIVHVPAPSVDRDVVQHVHAFQLAAALCLAAQPGERDARVDALVGLLEGSDDWTSAVAVLGLRAVAEAEPERAAEIAARLKALVPSREGPLLPMARALAVTGCELASGDDRTVCLQLRARIRRELTGD